MRALIGFGDPARAGVAEAMAMARRAGIHVVVVTGDHPTTATAIGRQVALPEGRVALGPEIDGMTDVVLAEALPGLAIVARSIPATKERIVRLARSAGHLVAVTGDGVNDAPALHAADVAVAMGSGTAVAKEASDLVLNDDSFATLVYGIEEGRRIVDNVQKGLVFLLSTHVALLGFILIATIAGSSQALLPIQVLWLELFIDLSASIAFEREPAEPDIMTRPPRPRRPPPVDPRLARSDRRRRRLQCGRCAVADDGQRRRLRAWPLAGLHGPCPCPGRPGVREPQPGAPRDDPAAQWFPAGRVPGHRRGPGPHPVRASARGRLRRLAAGTRGVGARLGHRARAGRLGGGHQACWARALGGLASTPRRPRRIRAGRVQAVFTPAAQAMSRSVGRVTS